MNRKALIIALLVSSVISYVLWNRVRKPAVEIPQAPVVQAPTILKAPALVCIKTIPPRTRLDDELLQVSFVRKDIIASAVPALAFTDIASLTGRYTAVTILPDDIMTPMRLLSEDQIPNLARAVPPGKRAVSLSVNKDNSVGGFIQQGDFVDVIAIFSPRGGEKISKLVLQNIQVLAIGSSYKFDGDVATMSPSISAAKAELITLAVEPDDLEKILLISSTVSWRFVLKNPQDAERHIVTKGATEKIVLSDIGFGDDEQAKLSAKDAAKLAAAASESAESDRIEINYGTSRVREIHKYDGVKQASKDSTDQSSAELTGAASSRR